MDAKLEYKLVAVLSDIHGNNHALEAVLKDVERNRPDRIVVCGDVGPGPFIRETLDRLMSLGAPASFVRGNGDRELVSAYDNHLPYNPDEKDPARMLAAWNAAQIDKKQRDFLAGFKDQVVLNIAGLGRVLFCHGSPRSDEEIITSQTPEAILDKFLAGIHEKTVVCGHTHHQFDRNLERYRVINAGSVGMPYEGRPGAYWAMLGPGVDFQRTEYDTERVVDEADSIGYPDASYRENLLTPPKAEEVAVYFEEVAAQRGERS